MRFRSTCKCLCAAMLIVFASCVLPPFDKSIEFGEVHNDKVQNGTAYDIATIRCFPEGKKLVLPDDSLIQRTTETKTVQLYMAKRMVFMGHPGKMISIVNTRKNIGCATRIENAELIVATYGEWGCMEGGTDLKIVAVVPEGIEIELRKGLSGDKSPANELHGVSDTTPGWTVLAAFPDPNHKAK